MFHNLAKALNNVTHAVVLLNSTAKQPSIMYIKRQCTNGRFHTNLKSLLFKFTINRAGNVIIAERD